MVSHLVMPRKRLQALQLGGPAALVGALAATVAAAVNGQPMEVVPTLQGCGAFAGLDGAPALANMDGTGGCAVGFYKLLEQWLPKRPLPGPEEIPHVCKITSLFEPELYMAQAVKAHKLKELHKTTEVCEQVLPTSSRQHNPADFQSGDLVVLGSGPHQGSAAVLCEMTSMDCKVAILDASRSFKVAEDHLKSSDLRLIHHDWRIGSRHIIGGLQSGRMKHLNGLVACVREHRRYGHPCFVPKPESSDLKLRLCVRWENLQENTNGALLLEPRFLSPCLTVPPLPPAPPAPPPPAPPAPSAPPAPPAPPPESQLNNKEASTAEPLPDTTLLTAKRRLPLNWNISCEGSGALRAIDEVEPTICHLPNVESLTPAPANCSANFLGVLSWMVGAHTRRVEEEFPTVIRLSSVLAEDPQPREQLSWLLPISESHELGDDADLVSEPTDRLYGITESLEKGDLVILERGLQPFALCPGVVKGVEGTSCTVAVLDDSRSVFIGECRVAFSDVALVHSEWRLGTRVVLGGLQSSHMVHLNGLSAVICPHKRHGHPCFVQKPSSPNTGEWLTLCIRFDDPDKSSMHAVLLEPRFLAPVGPPIDSRSHAVQPSPRMECFTPSSTSSTVPRSVSLTDSRGLAGKQGHGKRHWLRSSSYQGPPSATSSLGATARVPKQRSVSMSSTSPGSRNTLTKHLSSPSMSGEWRSFRDALGEEDLVKEIKELKESLKSLTKDQRHR
eukprot:s577_g17.t1